MQAVAALGAPLHPRPASAAPAQRMKVGSQNADSDAALNLFSALGVNHICSTLPSRAFDEHWSAQGLTPCANAWNAMASGSKPCRCR